MKVGTAITVTSEIKDNKDQVRPERPRTTLIPPSYHHHPALKHVSDNL